MEGLHGAGPQISVFPHAGVCPSEARVPLERYPSQQRGDCSNHTCLFCQLDHQHYLEIVGVKKFDGFEILCLITRNFHKSC